MEFLAFLLSSYSQKIHINTFAARLIQVVHAKTAGSHMALHENFSGSVSATDPVKSSKDAASPVACTRKIIFWLGVEDFL